MANSTTKSNKVLILGDDHRMLLPIIRSLGSRGGEVHLGWYSEDNPAQASRFVAAAHDIAIYVPGEPDWLVDLNNLMLAEDFDLVIPATEAAVHILQTNRAELARVDSIYLLNDEAFQVVTSKDKTNALAESLGIATPKSIPFTSDCDVQAIVDELTLPVIIKPVSSVKDHGQLNKHYVRMAHTTEDAIAYLNYLANTGAEALVQQRFDGEGVGVELLAKDGEVLFAIQHRRLHETNGHGSTYRETTKVDQGLLEAAAKMMSATRYTGVAMVEFRVDPRSGEWVLLEINGRFWGSLPLAAAAGADFPGFLFEMLTEGKTEFPQSYRVGVRCRCLTNDIRWTWRRLAGKGKSFQGENKDCLGWSVNSISNFQFACNVTRGLLCMDHVDTFAWRDPAPALCELQEIISSAASGVWSRITAKLRWLGKTDQANQALCNPAEQS